MFRLRRNITVSLVALLVAAFTCGSQDAAAVGTLQVEADSAVHLMERGAFLQALEPLRAAVAAYPYEPALRPLLVECTFGAALELLQKRAYADAAELLRRGQDLAPGEWRFWQLRGHVLMLTGDITGAETELELAVLKGDGPVESLRLLARLHYQRGELDRARQRLSEALEKSPDDADLKSFSAQIERELQVDARMTARSGGNFTVAADGKLNGDLGRDVLEVLERAYNAIGNLFGLYPDVQIPVILYGNKDFFAVTGAPDWSGGLFDGKIRVPVGGLQAMTPELAGVLYHEYAHVLIAIKGGKNVPLWFNEGLAQAAQALVVAPRIGMPGGSRLLPFRRLERSFADLGPADEVRLAYAQSYAFVGFLGERCGWGQVGGTLEKLGEGMPLPQAFAAAAGSCTEPFETIEALWFEGVERGAY